MEEPSVSISGRRLELPAGPIFLLKRAGDSRHQLGEFRAWAGYRNYGSDDATNDLIHFQHVLSFGPVEQGGRTGVHAHLAHAHVIIPTSGRGVFSYDGVETEATPGSVIVQHAGTVHDQFYYSYEAESAEHNRGTPITLEARPASAPPQSFSFLEVFVPKIFANVEIVPPGEVTLDDQKSAWAHPYHAAGERFAIQAPDAPQAAYRPMSGRPDLEVRDADTWQATGGLIATWFIRPASVGTTGPEVGLDLAGETGGVVVLLMVSGSARFIKADGEALALAAGDALTYGQGLVGDPLECSSDMRLVRFFVAAKAQLLRERTPEEIRRLEGLGPTIISRREVRPPDDTRPVNFLSGA